MKSSVYISSERIEVIGYGKSGKSVSVEEYATCQLPEGTMINGRIIDSGVLRVPDFYAGEKSRAF